MALKWIEGFELCGNSATMPVELSTKYNVVSQEKSLRTNYAGRVHGYALVLGKGTGENVMDVIRTQTLGNLSTMIVGFGLKRLNSATGYICNWLDGATYQISMAIDETHIVFRSGGDEPENEVASFAQAIDTNWHYIEIKIVFGNTGSVQVKLDGLDLGTVSSIDTTLSANSYANLFQFTSPGRAAIADDTEYWAIDDLYICDATGSVNNTFLGNVTVEGIKPSANGYLNDWTASSGSNYAAVDEVPANTSDYVTGDTASDIDSYAFGNLTQLISNVKGVSFNTFCKNNSAGSPVLKSLTRASSTNYENTGLTMTGNDWQVQTTVVETNPATSSSWTISEVNAAEFGIKLQST